MPSPLIVYPLDLTGTASSNLITGEVHDLSGLPANQNRAFVLNYGPFFTQGLIVKNAADGTVLTPATVDNPSGQYVATQLFVDATLQTGLEVCSVIVITDTTLPAGLSVSVTAQVLGGPYSASVDAIQQLIDGLSLGNQPVAWADILGKPVLFPPAPHLHDLGDIYGFEYLVAALERVTQAIYIGDTAQLNAIYQYIAHEVAGLQTNISTVAQNLTAHLADYTNPHHVTAAQVGLGNVQNYGVATTAQAQAGVATNVYMTPALVASAVTSQVGNALQAHLNDHSNPHQVTATQVGLGNVQNYGIATTAQAQAGTVNNVYMTPALVAAAITTQALTPLNAHINNQSNPHVVTAAQVGLGNVQNYGIATTADAQAGTSNALYMTPATSAQAIQYQVGNALQAHINNVANPHQVTAAQVGLGSVNNTSDANKPVSGPQQTALNLKASLDAAVNFASISFGNGNVYMYQDGSTGVNGLGIRTGTSASWDYFSFGSTGNFTAVNGKVVASAGFQPSDRNLKEHFAPCEARPLWRDIPWQAWRWREREGYCMSGKLDKGNVAQDVESIAPEYVDQEDLFHDGHRYRIIDKTGMALEQAVAAGHLVDELTATVDRQDRIIEELLTRMDMMEQRRSAYELAIDAHPSH